MDRIRFGILGCGNMGGQHFSGLRQLYDIAEFTCTCDIVPERAQKAAEALQEDKPIPAFTDYKDMVGLCDAVLVALPHALHYEVGLFFARRGVHVLMEKPLCNTPEQCDNLIQVCREAGVTLMVAYPVRYWPAIRKLKELCDSGEYGEINNMSIWTEQYTNPITRNQPWCMTKKSLGGGQFFSHGCHYVDILLWFLGEPVTGVHMGGHIGTPWMEGEGTSNAIMQFKSGAMGYHFGTWGARGTQFGYKIQIHLTKGLLDYDRAAGKITLYQNTNPDMPEGMPPEDKIKVLWEEESSGKHTQYEIRHFIECIHSGVRPDTDGARGVQSLRCIWRMYEAEEKGIVADLRGLGLEDA